MSGSVHMCLCVYVFRVQRTIDFPLGKTHWARILAAYRPATTTTHYTAFLIWWRTPQQQPLQHLFGIGNILSPQQQLQQHYPFGLLADDKTPNNKHIVFLKLATSRPTKEKNTASFCDAFPTGHLLLHLKERSMNLGKSKCPVGKASLEKAKVIWLSQALKQKHAHLSSCELLAYKLHKLLACSCSSVIWDHFLTKLNAKLERLSRQLMQRKRIKLAKLRKPKPSTLKSSKFIPNIIINKSNVILDENEEELLNKGLNFALPHKCSPINDIIVDSELALRKMEPEMAENVRHKLKQALTSKSKTKKLKKSSFLQSAVKSPNDKDIYITKADKGNCVVVLNREDYNRGMSTLIEEGNYNKVKDPLPKIKKQVLECRKKYSDLFGRRWAKKMHKSYVRVPCLYGLYKAHKPGNKFRSIIAGYTAPIANIASWLSSYFRQLKSFDNFSIRNSLELIEKIKNLHLTSKDCFASFDITSYFSNVPRNGDLDSLRIWLDKQNINPTIANALFDLTYTCTNQSFFQFRGEFYEQKDGLPMGLNISPFLCNLFMNTIEEQLIRSSLFPRFYTRYVDDCFIIIERNKIQQTLNLFNSMNNSIQFTCEHETNNDLPFLDLKLKHNTDGAIEFNIYRKPTSTERFIPIESNHHYSHKLAAFNSMVHRLINVPLSDDAYKKEKQTIIHIAETNGYSSSSIEKLVRKHRTKKDRRESSSFFETVGVEDKIDLKVAPKTTTKLKSLLNSAKDKCESLDKPGIYSITCSYKDDDGKECGAKYIGQSTRTVRTRFNEHLKYIKNIEPKSGIAEHALSSQHSISFDDCKLIKSESNVNRLNILESLHIYVNKNVSVNRYTGPLYSSLFTALQ
ncbi:uncharacterized protein [Eurosta solidaginis]|uniref:uncharacterized protein n=1 Tax=Eurosta solidaginis TaxID=178769 RepID=UPI00353166D5